MKNSLCIEWKPLNELGIPILDEQHRGIVSIINSFNYAIQYGKETELYISTIFTMVDCYTKLHFATEEDLMRSAGYPGFENHKKTHLLLLNQSFSTVSRSIRHNDPFVYLNFLHAWWTAHINGRDRQYAPLVKSHLGI